MGGRNPEDLNHGLPLDLGIVHTCTHVQIHTYICIYIYNMYIPTFLKVYVCIHIHMCVYTYFLVHAYIHRSTYNYVHICVYTPIHICIYAYTLEHKCDRLYMYIHKYTQTHLYGVKVLVAMWGG